MLGVETDGSERVLLAERRAPVDRLASVVAVADYHQFLVVRAIGRQRRPDTVPILARLLDSDDDRVRAAAALAVSAADPSSTADILRPLLADESDQVVEAAAAAFSIVGRPEDVPALAAASRHRSTEVRERVAKALGALADSSGIPPLRDMLRDDSRAVRRAARAALRVLGVAGAEQALATNQRRSALGRRRDALAARRNLRRAQRQPRWSIALPSTLRLRLINMAVTVIGALLLTATVADASLLVLAAVTVLTWFVGGFSLSVGLLNDLEFGVPGHDRARARARRHPNDQMSRPPTSTVALGLLTARGIIRATLLVLAIVGVEVLLPTGGVVAGLVAGLLVGGGIFVSSTQRRILASDDRTYTSVDRLGRVGPHLWLAPTPDGERQSVVAGGATD